MWAKHLKGIFSRNKLEFLTCSIKFALFDIVLFGFLAFSSSLTVRLNFEHFVWWFFDDILLIGDKRVLLMSKTRRNFRKYCGSSEKMSRIRSKMAQFPRILEEKWLTSRCLWKYMKNILKKLQKYLKKLQNSTYFSPSQDFFFSFYRANYLMVCSVK